MKSGIYLIINRVNGKFYVGSSCDIQSRFYQHQSDLSCNCHSNQHLQNAYNIDSESFSFVMLRLCPVGACLYIEEYYIAVLKPHYNISLKPTRGTRYGIPQSEKTKKKIGDGHRGKIVSVETRALMPKANRRRGSPTEETKKKLSESRKKFCNDPEFRRKLSEACKAGWRRKKELQKQKVVS